MKFYPFFVAAFASALIPVVSEARLIDKTVALVNSDVVLSSDTDSFKSNFSLRRELDPFVGLLNFAPSSMNDILEYLVQEQLVLQKQEVKEEEVEEEINAVQKNNRIDRDRLREVLKGQGVDFEIYKRLMRVSVAKRKLIDRELRPLAAVSDEEVKNYYYTDASTKERRSAQKLVLTYTMQQLLVPNQALAETAANRLKAGEDLDAVASEYAAQGAETSKLPELSEENMNATIREAVAGLKVGESTRPISTGNGYMMLKITQIGAPKDPVFESEKERIRASLFQKALQNQLRLWTEREKAASYVSFPKKA
ncbi:MAG: peptidyl-prolyl cis-trans isomerase [Proteobacteria bacterium]|nr:MAG: peptidyl-prolyl cis-trans isomerase [Pseudomonadota bacterium]